MKQIAKSFPDPEKNSPTEFRANLEQARRWTKKARNRLIILRSLGIDKPTKEQLSQFDLENIPEILPKQTIERQSIEKQIDNQKSRFDDPEFWN